MELMEMILSKENLNQAYKKVVANRGASGIDKITVDELGSYIKDNQETIIKSLRNRTYFPKPVRRVYIPKTDGKQRPLGIPTALDRTIQQAVAQPISDIYEKVFSEYSYGFRPNRSCHDAIRQALEYLNNGYEWVIDIDIEQFFDKVNHDKLIQILREQVNDSSVLNLIRKYLRAGVMENGIIKATKTGVPQGGPISVCKWLNLDNKKLENLVRTGLLHDIGKAKIKDSLLNKADALTLEEIEKLKAHPVIGYRILDNVNIFDPEVLQGVLFHHERMDGTGYPLGLQGEKINLFSKIIAIADTFDAITANKTYRKKNSPLKAIEEIQANSLNHLDPYICEIFIKNIIEYYCGRETRLSNEQVGIIVNFNPIELTKPLVRYENKIHDLSVERDVEVVEIL
jgi:retron-type reverse transcriptase